MALALLPREPRLFRDAVSEKGTSGGQVLASRSPSANPNPAGDCGQQFEGAFVPIPVKHLGGILGQPLGIDSHHSFTHEDTDR